MKVPVIKLSLNQPVVLYFVLMVALANLLYLAVAGKFEFVVIFIMVGFLTSFFSKNMTVIMVVAIVATSVLQLGDASGFEGLENETTIEKTETEPEPEPESAKTEPQPEPESAKPKPEPEPESAKTGPEPKKNEETKTNDPSNVIDKITDKQKDLVDKIAKMEPTLRQVENFVERLENFSKY